MDFVNNYAAGAAVKVTGRGIIDYVAAHTTRGHMAKGLGEASSAIETLDRRQEYLAASELKAFADRLVSLLDNRNFGENSAHKMAVVFSTPSQGVRKAGCSGQRGCGQHIAHRDA